MSSQAHLPSGYVYREIAQVHIAGYYLMRITGGEKMTYHGMTNISNNTYNFLFSGRVEDLDRIESEFQSSESRLFDDNVRTLKMQQRDAVRRGG